MFETSLTSSAHLGEPEEAMGVLEAGGEFRHLLGFCLERDAQ